jgi:hypothetical protein
VKRYLAFYGIWIAVASALVLALAAWYRQSEEITWGEVLRRVLSGNPNATDATDATGNDDGST